MWWISRSRLKIEMFEAKKNKTEETRGKTVAKLKVGDGSQGILMKVEIESEMFEVFRAKTRGKLKKTRQKGFLFFSPRFIRVVGVEFGHKFVSTYIFGEDPRSMFWSSLEAEPFHKVL